MRNHQFSVCKSTWVLRGGKWANPRLIGALLFFLVLLTLFLPEEVEEEEDEEDEEPDPWRLPAPPLLALLRFPRPPYPLPK